MSPDFLLRFHGFTLGTEDTPATPSEAVQHQTLEELGPAPLDDRWTVRVHHLGEAVDPTPWASDHDQTTTIPGWDQDLVLFTDRSSGWCRELPIHPDPTQVFQLDQLSEQMHETLSQGFIHLSRAHEIPEILQGECRGEEGELGDIPERIQGQARTAEREETPSRHPESLQSVGIPVMTRRCETETPETLDIAPEFTLRTPRLGCETMTREAMIEIPE